MSDWAGNLSQSGNPGWEAGAAESRAFLLQATRLTPRVALASVEKRKKKREKKRSAAFLSAVILARPDPPPAFKSVSAAGRAGLSFVRAGWKHHAFTLANRCVWMDFLFFNCDVCDNLLV